MTTEPSANDLAALEGGHEIPQEPQLTRLRRANVKRCKELWPDAEQWSLAQWGCAVTEEVGELCAELIRLNGEITPEQRHRIRNEIGDIVAYLDLLANAADLDLWKAIVHKFNAVSEWEGSIERLEP